MVLKWIGKVLDDTLAGGADIPDACDKALEVWLAGLEKTPGKVRSGLPGDIRSYFRSGEPAAVLQEISHSPVVGEVLGLGGTYRLATEKPPAFYAQFHELPVSVALRWAKVLEAAAGPHGTCVMGFPNGRRWPEVILMHAAGRAFNVYGGRDHKPLVKAATIEEMLEQDGLERSVLITAAFTTSVSVGWATSERLQLIAKLNDYGEALERHLESVRPVLLPTPVDQRLHVLGMLKAAKTETLARMANELCEHATANSKQVRMGAEPLLRKCGDAAFLPLKAIALEGKPEQRLHALRLIAQLGRERDQQTWIAFASETAVADKAPSVQALIEEWEASAAAAAEAENALPSNAYTVPSIDWSPAHNRVPIDAQKAFWREVRLRIERENDSLRERHKQAQAAGHKWSLHLCPVFGESDSRALHDYLDSAEPQPPKRKGEHHHIASNIIRQGIEALASSGVLTPVAALKMLMFFDLHGRQGETVSHALCRVFELVHQKTGRPTLLELSVMLDAVGVPGQRLLSSYCNRWGSSIASTWPDDHVWPYVAHYTDYVVQTLTAGTTAVTHYWFDRAGLYRAIRTLPAPPNSVINALFSVALGAAKSERVPAQDALRNLPGKEARIISALADGKSDTRAVAATWLARLHHTQATPALEQALLKEKHDVAKGAMLDALQLMGQPVEKYLDRDALSREAAKSLPKGLPKDIDWFPWSALPEVRWQDTQRSVSPEVLKWLLVQAVKQKSPEPNAVLRKYCAMFDSRDREGFGQFVLEAWLREDTKPIAPDDATAKAKVQAQHSHQWMTQYPQYAKDAPGFGKSVEELTTMYLPGYLRQPAGSATGSKGLLAVAAACAAERAAGPVQRYLKEWYGTRAAQGKALIAMLAWIEHPSAIQLMLAVGSRFRTKSFQEEATKQAQALADRKGWTLAELADRTVPSAGFDENGAMELSFGQRTFTAKLLSDFKIELFNPDGKKIASLPEPRQDDDPEAAKEAKKAFSAAKKEIKSIVDLQTDRLYEALCTERDWPIEDWRTYLQQHPVLRHLVQRLVWVQLDGGLVVRSFRPMDDGTLTDRDDNEVDVPADARVRIAHDSLLNANDVKAWLQHLADYEIKPLFQQLGKGTYELPKEKANAEEVTDFEGHLLEAFSLRGRALKLGYTRGAAEDGGWFHVYQKRFPTMGMEAVIEFTGNPLPEENRTVALINLSFSSTGGQQDWQRSKLPLAKVPKVLLSECYNDLRLIAAEGSGFDADWRKKTEY